jgi:hypothetical protein
MTEIQHKEIHGQAVAVGLADGLWEVPSPSADTSKIQHPPAFVLTRGNTQRNARDKRRRVGLLKMRQRQRMRPPTRPKRSGA